jgi:hypothetical protein
MDIQKLLQKTLSSLPAGTNVTINIAQPGAPIYHCVGGAQFIGTGNPTKSKKSNDSDTASSSTSSAPEEIVIIEEVSPELIVANDALNQTDDVPFDTSSDGDDDNDSTSDKIESSSEHNSLLAQAVEKGLPHSKKAQFMLLLSTNKDDVIKCLGEADDFADEDDDDHLLALLSAVGMTI